MHLSGNRLSLSSFSSSGLVMSGLKGESQGEGPMAPAHGWSKPGPKMSPNKQLKLNIRTPAIKPDRDCPVQYFEKNLLQSITLLSGYQQLQERNRKLDEDLKQGRQFTISYLIDELIKRKRDHEVVGRCVNMLRSIRDEYEVVKVQIAEDALKKAETVTVEKEVQCSAQYWNRSTQCEVKRTAEKGAQHVMQVKDEATEVPSTLEQLDKVPKVIQAVDTKESWTETEDGFLAQFEPTAQETKDGGLQKPEGNIKAEPAVKAVQTDAVNLCTNCRQPKVKKRVRFQTDEPPQDSQSSHCASNDFKRPILSMAPVNMFQNIIPQSILRGSSKDTSQAHRSSSGVPSRPAQASSSSKKPPKFSGRHLAKEELTRIYGSELAGEMVQRNKSHGDTALNVQSSSEITLKTLPNGCENVDSEPIEMPPLPRFDSKRTAQVDFSASQDDFAPFTPQHHRRGHAHSNSKNLEHRMKQNKFFKQVSSTSCKRKKKEEKTAKATSTKQMEDHKNARGPDKRLKSVSELLDEDADSDFSFDTLDLSSSLRIDDDYGSDKEHDKRKDREFSQLF